MTEVIKEKNPESPAIAALMINNGGVVIYPTETLYGLGANALSEISVRRVFVTKGRPYGKPIPLLVRDIEMFREVAIVTEQASKLIRSFLPGPLTLVLDEKINFPGLITADTGKVAVRISNHPFVKQLFRYISQPLTSTSANISGGGNLYDIKGIYDAFNSKVDLIIDSGTLHPSKGSTVVDLTKSPPSIIREGEISRELIEEFF
ncbi:MAG TPA: L-threonylcarbamoyladenylate synthase [Thermodesulfobacteriota bacterium]